mgnify:CR=1 FL=1
MNTYGPSPAQTKTIAERAGCAVVLDQPLQNGTVASHVECPTHGAKVRLLASLSAFDAHDPQQVAQLRAVADAHGGGPGTPPDERAARLLEWMQRTVEHAPESVETFLPAWRTIETGRGDCDDHARALSALYTVAGFKAGIGTLGDPPTHVAATVRTPSGWNWAESTIPGARLGEHPRAAVARVGAPRSDIGPGMGSAGDGAPRAIATLANALSVGAYAAGAYWATGPGRRGWAALAVAGDLLAKPVGVAAGNWDHTAQSLNDSVDFALAPLALHKAGSPFWAFPLVTGAQVAAKRVDGPGQAAGLIAAVLVVYAAAKH